LKTAIIFGSNCQDGYYLKTLLTRIGIISIGISRSKGDIIGDVTNYDFVFEIIKKYKPQYIFNFAASSSIAHEKLFENHNTISTGTLNILEAVRISEINTKVFISGSAMQFENNGSPITELTKFDPNSPYSVSRIHSVYLARYYRAKFGLKVYVGYLFNHDSPLRKENHINKKIVRFASRIVKGDNQKLLIGDINTRKEFNFAGDIVNAIWIFINQSNIFEIVIGSGKSYSINDWGVYVFSKFKLDWKKHIESDLNFSKQYDVLVSDPKLIYSLGWIPKVGFADLADMMIESEVNV
jgi:GDPmannose 4,6-dehydratase